MVDIRLKVFRNYQRFMKIQTPKLGQITQKIYLIGFYWIKKIVSVFFFNWRCFLICQYFCQNKFSKGLIMKNDLKK